ncbi:MAG: VTT domain-containing protein [Lutisporaceae bacterium]
MEYITKLLILIAYINKIIENVVISGGAWAYVVMFIMIYVGASFTLFAPVLPSVSLIFLVTSLSATGLINPYLSYIILILAICLGDITAYYIGCITRSKLIDSKFIRFIKAEHIIKTKVMYDKANFLTFLFARFTPVIGSLAQFIAGTIEYNFVSFVLNNVVAGILWMTFHFVAGWIFATIPTLEDNFVLMFFMVPIISSIIGIVYYVAKNTNIFRYLRQKRCSLLCKGDEV